MKKMEWLFFSFGCLFANACGPHDWTKDPEVTVNFTLTNKTGSTLWSVLMFIGTIDSDNNVFHEDRMHDELEDGGYVSWVNVPYPSDSDPTPTTDLSYTSLERGRVKYHVNLFPGTDNQINIYPTSGQSSTTPGTTDPAGQCSQASTICATYSNQCSSTVSQGPCYCAAACLCSFCDTSCQTENSASAASVNFPCPY